LLARVEDGGGDDSECAFGLSYRLETLCRDPIISRRGNSPNVEISHTRDVFQGTDLVKCDTGLSYACWDVSPHHDRNHLRAHLVTVADVSLCLGFSEKKELGIRFGVGIRSIRTLEFDSQHILDLCIATGGMRCQCFVCFSATL
jgi:hypothetical protein